MWPWQKNEPEDFGRPETISEKADRAVDELKAKRKLVGDIHAELDRMKKAAAEEIEKPIGKYRIYRQERADNSEGKDGYYVQSWSIEQLGWRLIFYDDVQWYRVSGIPESRYIDRALSWENAPRRGTYISWHNVGSANPHPTYEEAEAWLRKWLRPETEETFFDELGEKVE